MLTVYGGPDRQSLDEDELELASILGATAAMGYANALAFRKLEASNTGLESTVEQRTDELKTTLEEVQPPQSTNSRRSRHDQERTHLSDGRSARFPRGSR